MSLEPPSKQGQLKHVLEFGLWCLVSLCFILLYWDLGLGFGAFRRKQRLAAPTNGTLAIYSIHKGRIVQVWSYHDEGFSSRFYCTAIRRRPPFIMCLKCYWTLVISSPCIIPNSRVVSMFFCIPSFPAN